MFLTHPPPFQRDHFSSPGHAPAPVAGKYTTPVKLSARKHPVPAAFFRPFSGNFSPRKASYLAIPGNDLRETSFSMILDIGNMLSYNFIIKYFPVTT